MVIPHHFIDSECASFLDSWMYLKLLYKITFSFVFLQASLALAQESKASLPSSTTITSFEQLPLQPGVKKYQLGASVFSYNYFNGNDVLNRSENEYGLSFKYNDQSASVVKKADIRFGGYPKNKFSYFAVPELYIANSSQNAFQWTLGRKVASGSEIDQRFNLGLINPVLTQDYIHYESQGLTGLSAVYTASYFKLGFGFMGLYVPNQGPMVEEDNGQIITANRWAKKPPVQFAFNNQNKAIVYSIKDYKFEDIIFNSGARAELALGQKSETPVLSLSYSRQPINEVVLARETYANLDIIGQVQLAPVVVYTKNVTADLSYKKGAATYFASFIQDAPENKSAPEYHSIQNLEGITGYAMGLEYQIDNKYFHNLISEISAAEFYGGKISDLNSDGGENIFTFTKQRLQFTRPLQFKVQSDFNVLGQKKLTTVVKWLYDQKQRGTMFSGQLALQQTQALQLSLGADVLGKDDENLKDELFLDQYKSNDRVYGGMVYVF